MVGDSTIKEILIDSIAKPVIIDRIKQINLAEVFDHTFQLPKNSLDSFLVWVLTGEDMSSIRVVAGLAEPAVFPLDDQQGSTLRYAHLVSRLRVFYEGNEQGPAQHTDALTQKFFEAFSKKIIASSLRRQIAQKTSGLNGADLLSQIFTLTENRETSLSLRDVSHFLPSLRYIYPLDSTVFIRIIRPNQGALKGTQSVGGVLTLDVEMFVHMDGS